MGLGGFSSWCRLDHVYVLGRGCTGLGRWGSGSLGLELGDMGLDLGFQV